MIRNHDPAFVFIRYMRKHGTGKLYYYLYMNKRIGILFDKNIVATVIPNNKIFRRDIAKSEANRSKKIKRPKKKHKQIIFKYATQNVDLNKMPFRDENKLAELKKQMIDKKGNE